MNRYLSGQLGLNPTGDFWEIVVENVPELFHLRNEEAEGFTLQLPSDTGVQVFSVDAVGIH